MSFDRQDYSAIYAEYYPKIAGYLRRLVGDEADDVAQETFIKVSKALNGFRGESSLSTWIHRIATNTAMDHLRKPVEQARRQAGSYAAIEKPPDGEEVVQTDSHPLVDALLIRKDMHACIRGLVNDLPESYRSVLILGDLENLTNAEIADLLGLSLDTVKIRLHRGRQRLKKAMDQSCHLYHDERNVLSCDRKMTALEFVKK